MMKKWYLGFNKRVSAAQAVFYILVKHNLEFEIEKLERVSKDNWVYYQYNEAEQIKLLKSLL